MKPKAFLCQAADMSITSAKEVVFLLAFVCRRVILSVCKHNKVMNKF